MNEISGQVHNILGIKSHPNYLIYLQTTWFTCQRAARVVLPQRDSGVEKPILELGKISKKEERNRYALIPCTAYHLVEGTRRDLVWCVVKTMWRETRKGVGNCCTEVESGKGKEKGSLKCFFNGLEFFVLFCFVIFPDVWISS